jgi:hypothetical protein
LPDIPGSPLCPTNALFDLLALTDAFPKSAAILSFSPRSSPGSRVSLGAAEFTSILRTILARNGFPAADFSIHSFRRGAATFASSIGVPNETVKFQGNWRTDCYEIYVDRASEHRQNFAKSMANAIRNYQRS